jgi:hypothetical protein
MLDLDCTAADRQCRLSMLRAEVPMKPGCLSWSGARRGIHGLVLSVALAACVGDLSTAPSDLELTELEASLTLSDPVVVQAYTIGPNGELVQAPATYTVCGFGTLGVDSNYFITWIKDCDTRPLNGDGFVPYDGGSVTVTLLHPQLPPTHLGTFRANYTRLTLHDLPSGSSLELSASPEAPSTFTAWTDYQQTFTAPTIVRPLLGGDIFVGELQKHNSSGGSGGPGGDSCILCL